nr:ATP-dependent Clp protease proteolytic subunit [Brevibacterium sp. Marseille-P9724]
MLAAVKELTINAYGLKTGMSRAKLARLMDQETWMDARAAISMGFVDDNLTGNAPKATDPDEDKDDDENPDTKPPLPPKTRKPAR